jgi:hypothetical protein
MTITDFLHILLISFDPFISSIRQIKNNIKFENSPEVKSLLIISDSDYNSESDSDKSDN